ncbi:sensor histidine kinase [Ramlibacter sp.]|uniref:sensor histidine kinase n=1 Tax=Ramlibacter sp. TaxID=1917967 RepID=UPI0035AFFA88
MSWGAGSRWGQGGAMALAALALAFFAGLSVFTALSEPSVAWRFAPDPQGAGVLVYSPQRAVKVQRREDAEARLVALRSGDTVIPLDSLGAVEAPSMLPRQEDLDRFFTLQRQAWAVLDAARDAGGSVAFQRDDGTWIERPVRDRGWGELGWLYWVPLACGVIPFVVGLGVGRYRWGNAGARFLALASAMAMLSLAEVAVVTGRLWLLAPWFAESGQIFVRCASLVAVWAFAMMLLHYPTPLRGAAFWTRASAALLAVLLVLNGLQWPASQTLRYKLWLVVASVALIAFALRQAFGRRDDPVHRAAGRWLAASAVVSFSIVMYAFAVSLVYGATAISNSYRWVSVPLLYIGLVVSVGRANLFELERWWVPLVLWWLGGTLVVLTDLALVALLRVDAGAAITLSLLVIGWLYFPARQWLLARLAFSAQPRLVTYVPDLIAAVNAGLAGERAAAQAWRELLQRVFAPQHLAVLPLLPGAAPGGAEVRDQGRVLVVPGLGDQLVLTLAQGGRSLFTRDHADLAGQMWQLLDHGLARQRQTQEAVQRERLRIASDLHDDLGARLLSLVQAGAADGTAPMARQALEEMRQSVRGMAGRAVPAAEALADWRAELVGRLDGAGFTVDWQAEPPADDPVLSPRLHLQLTRVLREAVSNVVRHSGGSRCRVRVTITEGEVDVQVEDDGRGWPNAPAGNGLGLPSLERRARKLGGRHRFDRSALGGALVQVTVPLGGPVEEDDLAAA